MTTKADKEPIRLSPERLQYLKDRMRAASIDSEVHIDQDDPIFGSEQGRLEYEARCAARLIIHEHVAYGLERGEEWSLAMSVLCRPFDVDEYNFDDQLANSMLGVDFLIERRKMTSSEV